MATKWSKYYIYPGKQQDPMIVPVSYQPIFFEGVQTFDGNANTTDMQHGQHGWLSNVIDEKSFDNVSGTVSLKNLGHMWPVLRALCNQDPDKSFVFDPAYMQKCDVYVNVSLKDRSKVMYSSWYADFAGSYSGANPIDDASTADIAYSATRLLTFDGYQIFTDCFPDTKAGDATFRLTYPAVVSPVMNNVVVRSPSGVVTGQMIHEMCPVEFALRVWIGDEIVVDPDQAMIRTQAVPSPIPGAPPDIISYLELKGAPVSKDGQIVKCMYLIPGDVPVTQTGVSKAPLMVNAHPYFVDSGPGSAKIWSDFNNPTDGWNDILVNFSRMIDPNVLANWQAGTFGTGLTPQENFVLEYELTPGNFVTVPCEAITFIGDVEVQTDNAFWLGFPTGWPTGTSAVIHYIGNALRDAEGNITPPHSIIVYPDTQWSRIW